ncbi:MAG TPA: hypothetical protein PLO89_07455 [Spirochaetota bacterium]|nr:hypothetical protein [Spirochaetota bacterium]
MTELNKLLFSFFLILFISSFCYSNALKKDALYSFEKTVYNLKNKNSFNKIIFFETETQKKENKINYEYVFAAGVALQSIAALIGISFLPVLGMGIVKAIEFTSREKRFPSELVDDLAYFLTFGIAIGVSFAIQIPAVPLMIVGSSKGGKKNG